MSAVISDASLGDRVLLVFYDTQTGAKMTLEQFGQEYENKFGATAPLRKILRSGILRKGTQHKAGSGSSRDLKRSSKASSASEKMETVRLSIEQEDLCDLKPPKCKDGNCSKLHLHRIKKYELCNAYGSKDSKGCDDVSCNKLHIPSESLSERVESILQPNQRMLLRRFQQQHLEKYPRYHRHLPSAEALLARCPHVIKIDNTIRSKPYISRLSVEESSKLTKHSPGYTSKRKLRSVSSTILPLSGSNSHVPKPKPKTIPRQKSGSNAASTSSSSHRSKLNRTKSPALTSQNARPQLLKSDSLNSRAKESPQSGSGNWNSAQFLIPRLETLVDNVIKTDRDIRKKLYTLSLVSGEELSPAGDVLSRPHSKSQAAASHQSRKLAPSKPSFRSRRSKSESRLNESNGNGSGDVDRKSEESEDAEADNDADPSSSSSDDETEFFTPGCIDLEPLLGIKGLDSVSLKQSLEKLKSNENLIPIYRQALIASQQSPLREMNKALEELKPFESLESELSKKVKSVSVEVASLEAKLAELRKKQTDYQSQLDNISDKRKVLTHTLTNIRKQLEPSNECLSYLTRKTGDDHTNNTMGKDSATAPPQPNGHSSQAQKRRKRKTLPSKREIDDLSNEIDRVGDRMLHLTQWEKWKCADVVQWISKIERGRFGKKYTSNFRQLSKIETGILTAINDGMLQMIGISDATDRNDIITHIARFKNRIALLRGETTYMKANECVACQSREPDQVCMPCGHLCFCRGCKDEYVKAQNKQCPICRKNVDKWTKIYIA